MSKNAAIFDRIWKEAAYLDLHRAKDAVNPFSTPANSPERTAALVRFDAACKAINDYEIAAGIK